MKRRAPDPREPLTAKTKRGIDLEAGRRHWAYQPVREVAPPMVREAAWPLNEVDAFVLAKLEAEGLKPVADADPHTWLRRVTFDLTGLPPTEAEIAAFQTRHGIWSNVNRVSLPDLDEDREIAAKHDVKLTGWRQEKESLVNEAKSLGEKSDAESKKRRDELAAQITAIELRIAHGEYFHPGSRSPVEVVRCIAPLSPPR